MDLPFGNELPDLDVLIVGAGLSGLTSAVKILAKENSLNLKIIDESSNAGGQLCMQGMRQVNREQTDMINFLNQINVIPSPRDESEISYLKRCWELDRGLLAGPIKFELSRYIYMLDLRMKKFSSLRFNLLRRIPTMERHICSNLFFKQSRQFMFNLVEFFSGVPPSQINYDEFMCLCSSCGGLNVIIDIYFEMPRSMMDVSSKKLLETLFKKIESTEIITNVKVLKVKHFKNYVEVASSLGQSFTAQTVILAIPWDRIQELQFEPPLPSQYLTPLRGIKGPRNLLTQFRMKYIKSHWVYQGYSGNFLNVQPFVVGYENGPGEYSGYVLHSPTESANVKDLVMGLLSEHFGEEMQSPLEYRQQSMELSTPPMKPILKPWLRIIFAGSATAATRNRNLMSGAVESGIRASVNALYVVRPQVVGWRDLDELQDKRTYDNTSPCRFVAFLSRINLYNFTFYSFFVIGVICLLKFGDKLSS